MPSGSPIDVAWKRRPLLSLVLLLVGLALVGYGGYTHFTVTAQLSAGQCDGCAPWHPLFVIAPFIVGGAFVLVAGYLLAGD